MGYSKTQLKAMSKDELESLASELGVYPESGSGADGNVVVTDLVDAIYDSQAEPESAPSARDATVRCHGCGAINVIVAVPGETFTFYCGACGRGDVISIVAANRG